MTEQVKGDVGLRVDGVARANCDAMQPPVDWRQLALGFVCYDNWNKRRRRGRELPQGLRRVENDCEVACLRSYGAIREETRQERKGLILRVGSDDERPLARLVEPVNESASVSGDRRFEDLR